MNNKKPGNWAWFILWLFVFLPIAIYYAITRDMSNEAMSYHPRTEEQNLKEAFMNEIISSEEYQDKLAKINDKKKIT